MGAFHVDTLTHTTTQELEGFGPRDTTTVVTLIADAFGYSHRLLGLPVLLHNGRWCASAHESQHPTARYVGALAG